MLPTALSYKKESVQQGNPLSLVQFSGHKKRHYDIALQETKSVVMVEAKTCTAKACLPYIHELKDFSYLAQGFYGIIQ